MKEQNGFYWFRLAVKILTPISFWAIATWPKGYWLAGVMTIAFIFALVLEWQKIGDTKL